MAHPTTGARELEKLGEPEDIAQLVVFLCSHAAGFITGQNFSIDGGVTAVQPTI